MSRDGEGNWHVSIYFVRLTTLPLARTTGYGRVFESYYIIPAAQPATVLKLEVKKVQLSL
jgi:hypothetical protein